MEYWSWWAGALGLGGVSIVYLLLTGRLLGVSASWSRVLSWRESRELEQARASLKQNLDETENVLLAATIAEFGDQAVAEMETGILREADSSSSMLNKATQAATPWGVHVTFLCGLLLGALVVALWRGEFMLRFDINDVHSAIFGGRWEVWTALFAGGVMVGFGTQMAGGCTSGHGLSGCARLIPASLFSTLVFMLSAIGLSLLMEAVR